MSQKIPSKTVFVGNIPYGVSEEQIIDIFSRVGTVNNFRLVHDKETGRPKGFGFLEYTDTDTAAAAVRNLNDHDIMGRKLRVDWSNDSSSNPQQETTTQISTNGPDNHDAASALPPLPAGTDSPPGLTAPDAISQTLSAMPAPQLLDLISQMKGMVSENPAQVTQLFNAAPQLAYAIFQALLLLGLTDVSVLSSIVQAASAPAPQPLQQSQPQPQYTQPQPPPPNPFSGYPPYQQQAAVPTPPPVQQQPYQPPQPSAPVPTPDQGAQTALIQQLMHLTTEQIFQLPAESRDQILQLRAQLGLPFT
ncbi:hypothetical protein ANO11243_036100 [Dothideomycetidae sp. 11243]|nr:hypothetical protein ANO11243_036100 [fungal sp. No.11243]